MNAQELRSLDAAALAARAKELWAAIVSLRFGSAKEKNVRKLSLLRHERARALTVLREKEDRSAGRHP